MVKKTIFRMIRVVMVAGIAGCAQKEISTEQPAGTIDNAAVVTLTPASIKEIDLRVEKIALKPFADYVAVPAKVLANQDNEAVVGSLVPGRVCKVFVKAGDQVKAGQKLMLLEGLEIGEIKAGFLSARANLEYQRSNYERQKKLMDEKIGAQKTLLEAQNEYDRASAEYHAEKSRISAIGLTEAEVADESSSASGESGTEALAVKSPIDGIVVERTVVIGQLIEASTTAFKIINLSSVWVDGQVYEKDAGRITGKTLAEFSTSSNPAETVYGKIIYTGQVVNEETRTITVRAEFNNADKALKPQMFGELRIAKGNNRTALFVPAEAVIRIDNADYVFRQKEEAAFEKTPVTVGVAQTDLVEISAGLKEGDKVVVKGAFYLKSELLKSSLGGE